MANQNPSLNGGTLYCVRTTAQFCPKDKTLKICAAAKNITGLRRMGQECGESNRPTFRNKTAACRRLCGVV